MSEAERELSLLLSLAAASGGEVEQCPGPAAVAAWQDGALDAEQARLLKRHLRVCRNCYRDWLALVEVADLVAPKGPGGRSGIATRSLARIGGWPPIGALVAASIAMLALWQLLAPLPRPAWEASVGEAYAAFFEATTQIQRAGLVDVARWAWQPGLGSRSLAATEEDLASAHGRARYAFAAGVRSGLEQLLTDRRGWHRVLRELPDEPLCESPTQIAECGLLDDLYGQLGRWAVLLHFACAGLTPDGVPRAGFSPELAFWDAQAALLRDFSANLKGTLRSGAFGLFLEQWVESLPPAGGRTQAHAAARGLCAREAALLSLGLN